MVAAATVAPVLPDQEGQTDQAPSRKTQCGGTATVAVAVAAVAVEGEESRARVERGWGKKELMRVKMPRHARHE